MASATPLIARPQTIGEIEAAIHLCRRCPLHRARTCAVPGEGPAPCDLMLVGEGPGETEDASGRPFVGKAGQLLRKLLREEARVDPKAVYWTNVVKCRSTVSRGGERRDSPPPRGSIEACAAWLRLQRALVQPRAILVVGGTACQHLLGMPILRAHGTLVEDRTEGVFYLPLVHPAAALRAPEHLEALREGLCGVGLWLDAHPEIRRRAGDYSTLEESRNNATEAPR
jgi:DNA polymerase